MAFQAVAHKHLEISLNSEGWFYVSFRHREQKQLLNKHYLKI